MPTGPRVVYPATRWEGALDIPWELTDPADRALLLGGDVVGDRYVIHTDQPRRELQVVLHRLILGPPDLQLTDGEARLHLDFHTYSAPTVSEA